MEDVRAVPDLLRKLCYGDVCGNAFHSTIFSSIVDANRYLIGILLHDVKEFPL